MPEPSHIPTLHDTQLHDDLVIHSVSPSPLPVGLPPSRPEPDFPDTVSNGSMPDLYQDNHLPQPANESAAISDTELPHRSTSPFHLPLFDACGIPEAAHSSDDTSLSTQPVSSSRHIGEPNSPQSTQSLLSEASFVTEVDATDSVQLSTGEPLPGEIRDTRHQEPPFMTDGRGRVVWSCSGAKRGSSPLAIRSL